ncbi:MAG TPA: hypothetical protein VHF92_05415 [Geodermatophilus sp.]|nr:hypothetical protein [Geodermatophilus sp.]
MTSGRARHRAPAAGWKRWTVAGAASLLIGAGTVGVVLLDGRPSADPDTTAAATSAPSSSASPSSATARRVGGSTAADVAASSSASAAAPSSAPEAPPAIALPETASPSAPPAEQPAPPPVLQAAPSPEDLVPANCGEERSEGGEERNDGKATVPSEAPRLEVDLDRDKDTRCE